MAFFALTLLLTLITLLIIIVHICRIYNKRPKNFPPGPPRLPLWGSYWFLLKENYYFMETAMSNLAKKYKTNILGLYMGDFPTVVVMDNELCKEVLTRREFEGRNDTIISRGRCYGEILGIFFLDEEKWKEQRRFSLRHLRDYGFGRRFSHTEHLLERDVQDLISIFNSAPKSTNLDFCRKKGQVRMPEVFYPTLLNSILYILIGKRIDDHKQLRDFAKEVYNFAKMGDSTGNALCSTPWLRYFAPGYFKYTDMMNASDCFTSFFKVQIEEHKQRFCNDYLGDFVDVYLSKLEENNKNGYFNDDQLLWTLIDYTFPVAASVGYTLNFMFMYLINNSTLQEKLQSEIDTIVGKARLPSLNDRPFMPYTEAFIREALRKDTIIPLGVPKRCLEDTVLGGYDIPKGSMIITHLEGANNDPKVYDNPNEFRPERFLDKDGKLLKKDHSMPFGAGKRLCAGETFSRQLLFTIITGLLQNFTFKAADKLPDPNEKVWGIVITTPDLWVEATPR